MIKQLLLVGLGGGVGSILRFLVAKLMGRWPSVHFALSTFLVNVIGCFLIGYFYSLWVKSEQQPPGLGLLLITGFCGGFTTFSSFSHEGMRLLQEGQYLSYGLYVGGSIVLGLLAVALGMFLGH